MRRRATSRPDPDAWWPAWPPLFPHRRPRSGPPDAAHAVHLAYNEIAWRRARRHGGRAKLLVRQILWSVRSIGLAIGKTAALGPWVRDRTGKGVLRQLAEQLRLSFGAGVPPATYYLFRLYREDRRREAAQYLHRFETKRRGVYMRLNQHVGRVDRALEDKRLFHERCRAHGLPVPALLLHLRAGEVETVEAEAAVLPPRDLVVKPDQGKGGSGVERWDWVEGDGFRSPDGERLAPEALLRRLRERSRTTGLLVQARAVVHPALADLTHGALSTARVLGCWDEQRQGEPTIAVFRMAVDSACVDNIHAGGIASPVDLATGRLGSAAALDPRSEWLDRHPRTGAPIAGRTLPDWPTVLDLVRRAHRAFPSHAVAGWDVGLAADGPVLIEGNSSPCVNLIQRPHDRPLGRTRFAELLAFHLEAHRHGVRGAVGEPARGPAAGARSAPGDARP